MEGHVHFEDLDLEFGYSCMPDRLHYYSKEENDFRMGVRQWCKENVLPVAEKIDRERDKELAVEVLRKMKPYLHITNSFLKTVFTHFIIISSFCGLD